MKEVGYHGTCSKYRDSIEKEGFDPRKCKHRSDHWLGQGVYFFDDYEKALWWANSISSKNGNCGSVVFKVSIEAPDDAVLNLDDKDQLDHFITQTLQMPEDIAKECGGKMPVFDDRKFRAVFFDYYKEKNDISVIIGTFEKDIAGYTAKRSFAEREKQKKFLKYIGIYYHERQICVSRKECIKSTELVYNEEDEVI